ncbi:MOB kinase activator 2-like isoform X1 [Branchiostoma floridae]|uniref:MOB kinase activator 2-like isoform X1 n=1 Tax=Branchiostoma floridae TaxID=7739 RepID=A0A9J7L1J5_BRAFL|nr:MOB kinase activator 2-like isoform X1 [Branchiostoma floridae]
MDVLFGWRYTWEPSKNERKASKKEKKPVIEEKKEYLDQQYVQAAITDQDLRIIVRLPEGIDQDEWLATNTISFFHNINLLYSTISEYCTSSTCPNMSGPGNTQYTWYDEKGKKTKCSAAQYVDYVMSFMDKHITDESVFPTKFGHTFPNGFEATVKKFFRLLLHVISHIYHAHYRELVHLDVHAHMNSAFAHFILFTHEFRLIDPKETVVLDDLVEAMHIFPSEKDDVQDSEKQDAKESS